MSAHCQKNPKDYDSWTSRLAEGRPKSWGHPREQSATWSIEERERVLEAFGEMPKVFKKPTIDAVYRMSRSDTPENPASTQGTNIVLYDDAFNPKYVLTEVLEHELAHQVFLDLPRRVQDSFRDAAGWRNDEGGTLRHRPESQFLRKNGMLSPDEDFADSLGAFFHKPTKLKKTSPQVYNWMKAHFK